jgi:hypothetical protein
LRFGAAEAPGWRTNHRLRSPRYQEYLITPMSKRHFSILLLITVVVAAAVFLMPSRTGRDSTVESELYLPELAGVVNDLEIVRISAAGGAEVVTLARREDGWVVEESHAYPADWSVLRPLLADLSQAEVLEAKTSNPEYYDRLGVEDPSNEDASGKLIEFPGMDALPAVIVGDQPQGREGRYLRRQGEPGSVLVDRSITLPAEASAWMDREIVDVPNAEVVGVRISHADGDVINIHRNSTDVTDFTLDEIPEGRKTRSAWTINQLASGLAALELDGVAPVDEVTWQDAIELQVRTEDGLQIDARLAQEEERRWLRLEASGSEAAEAINERVEGWAYEIPLYKYDAVNKRMEDLLAEVEDESGSPGPSTE